MPQTSSYSQTFNPIVKDPKKLDTDYTDLDGNPLYHGFKTHIHMDMSGVRDTPESIRAYLNTISKANKDVSNNPNLLDKYKIDIDSHNAPNSLNALIRMHEGVAISEYEKILYYRANPWLFAYDVIGLDVLERSAPVGTPFHGFMKEQKQFLRDALDPRVRKLKLRCNRGGSKTFLLGLICVIAEYLIPKCRITIQSGNEDQAETVYREYFEKFLKDTELDIIVVNRSDGIQKRRTTFIHGGYVCIRTASLKAVKGPRPDILIIDEVYGTTNEFCIAAFGGVVTAHHMKILMSGTPDTMTHMAYTIDPNLEHLQVKDGWKIYHWTAYDCPWISEDNINDFKSSMTREEFTIWGMGNHAAIRGHVYDPEQLELSTVAEYPPGVAEYVSTGVNTNLKLVTHGVDWGSAHPATYVTLALAEDGLVYVVDSFLQSRMRIEDFLGKNMANHRKYLPHYIGADGSAPTLIRMYRDYLAEANMFNAVTPMHFNQVKYSMIAVAQLMIEKGLLRICPTIAANKQLLEQLKAYEWAKSEVQGGSADKQTIKVNDDLCDAFAIAMYLLQKRSKQDYKSMQDGMVISKFDIPAPAYNLDGPVDAKKLDREGSKYARPRHRFG